MSNIFTEQINERKQADEAMRLKAEALISDATIRSSFHDVMGKLRSNEDALKRLLDMCGLEEEQLEHIDKEDVLFTRVESDEQWYHHHTGYCLGKDKQGGYRVILPGIFFGYYYFDQNGKKRRINAKNTDTFTAVYCLCRLLPEKKLNIPGLLKYLLSYLRMRALNYYIILSLLAGVLGLIFPWLVNHLLGSVGEKSANHGSILWLIAGLCLMAELIRLFLNVMLGLFESRFTNMVSYNVKNAALVRYLSDTSGKNAGKSAVDIYTAINDVIPEFVENLLSSGMGMVPHLIFVLCYCAAAVVALGKLSLNLFIVLGILAAIVWFINVHFDKWYSQAVQNRIRGNRLLFQVFKGIEKIRSREAQKRVYFQWAGIYSEEAYCDKIRKKYHAVYLASQDFVIPLMNTILICTAAMFPISRSELFTGTLMAGLLTAEVTTVIYYLERIVNSKSLWSMISFLFDVPEYEKKAKCREFTGEVSVQRLSFSYPGMECLLNDVSFEVKKGEYVGIVGMSGCGKSTLLKLLLGILTPKKGDISYGKYGLSETNQRSILCNMGIILQNETLIPGTIRQNMMMQPRPVTEEKIWETFEKIGIADMVRSYPDGLDTEIGITGAGMSGGQMQKFLIARAIISEPKMIVFDEATSALDNVSQKEIKETLDRMNCTRIVVAHRLSTVKDCDKIIVLDKGQICQQGTYEELVSEDGLFRELIRSQGA